MFPFFQPQRNKEGGEGRGKMEMEIEIERERERQRENDDKSRDAFRKTIPSWLATLPTLWNNNLSPIIGTRSITHRWTLDLTRPPASLVPNQRSILPLYVRRACTSRFLSDLYRATDRHVSTRYTGQGPGIGLSRVCIAKLLRIKLKLEEIDASITGCCVKWNGY